MAGGGSESPPPVEGGEFLLQLLTKSPNHHHHHHLRQPPPQTPTQVLNHDPAVAAVGPTLPVPFPHLFYAPSPPWPHSHLQSPPPFAPHGFFLQNPSPNSNSNPNLIFPSASRPGFDQGSFQQHDIQFNHSTIGDDVTKLGFFGNDSNSSSVRQQDPKDLIFGSFSGNEVLKNGNFSENLGISSQKERREMGLGKIGRLNGCEVEFQQNSVDLDHQPRITRVNSSGFSGYGNVRSDHNSKGPGYWDAKGPNLNDHRAAVPPPEFTGQQMNRENREYSNRKKGFEHGGEKGRNNFRESRYRSGKVEVERRFLSRNGRNDGDGLDDKGLGGQLDRPGPSSGSTLHSVSVSEIEEPMMSSEIGESGKKFGNGIRGRIKRDGHKGCSDLDDLEEQLVDSLRLEDKSDEKSVKKKQRGSRDKHYRSDKRGQQLLVQRLRYKKRQVACRGDIDRLNNPFLEIYESLIPAEEEKAKQKQLLTLLEKIVCKEWPDARLCLYGSCGNSFGFSKSDIDVCLTIGDEDINKSEVLLKLADMLQLDNLQNVQALTRARVPIVKLMDPSTGISCDICINNVLAVVNTKLLRDYAEIDLRLRQLAFIVKHWAKTRGVNETYQGTLSSYAYVLMCIHFLQQRRPAILPCLQEMKTTYSVTVDNVECSYFDQVESLIGFGSRNRESIAQLVWAFFSYWAYFHNYANDVISVRTGTILSKRTKDWTKRIGNDRHLICIEDPFEISHDLGRVVDKSSIRVLREEFERAAEIMQDDPNPCVKLFEPYVPT
ncbi:hypothetical protein ACH5RR_023957 [Cinchona calisaya]|uniref:RNA uridylyltransferase n=1 Tax=Cinchona calisaya TaxID=153742 RepID=A0ABD2ZC49_9GENT